MTADPIIIGLISLPPSEEVAITVLVVTSRNRPERTAQLLVVGGALEKDS